MVGSILIIQGHPDCSRQHLCHALADAYAKGAAEAGQAVERIEPARLRLPLLDDPEDWQHRAPTPQVALAQDAHGVRLLRRNILGFAGIAPVRTTLVGGAGMLTPERVEHWCRHMRRLGSKSS